MKSHCKEPQGYRVVVFMKYTPFWKWQRIPFPKPEHEACFPSKPELYWKKRKHQATDSLKNDNSCYLLSVCLLGIRHQNIQVLQKPGLHILIIVLQMRHSSITSKQLLKYLVFIIFSISKYDMLRCRKQDFNTLHYPDSKLLTVTISYFSASVMKYHVQKELIEKLYWFPQRQRAHCHDKDLETSRNADRNRESERSPLNTQEAEWVKWKRGQGYQCPPSERYSLHQGAYF